MSAEIRRREILTGMVGLIAAPAIVRASSLMPVRAWAEFSDPARNFAYLQEEMARNLAMATQVHKSLFFASIEPGSPGHVLLFEAIQSMGFGPGRNRPDLPRVTGFGSTP